RSHVLIALFMFAICGTAAAQITGTLTGTVTSGGSPLPGATVTVASPVLLGTRTTVTGAGGDYNFGALTPGTYRVTFELEGLQKVSKQARVRLGETTRLAADLRAAITEAITVTATTPSVLETPQVSTTLDRALIESLPVGRTIAQRVQLAPGVNNAGPNNQ